MTSIVPESPGLLGPTTAAVPGALGPTPSAPAPAPVPLKKKQPQPPLKPAAPVKPELKPPNGPLVPALQQIGFHGGIGDFAQNVVKVVQDHQARFGYTPSAAAVLQQATQTQPPKVEPVNPVLDNPGRLLNGLLGNARAGAYDQFMQMHGAQINELLSNPATKGQAAAALTQAKQIDAMSRKQAAGGDIGDVAVGLYVHAPTRAAKFAARTGYALGQDTAALTEWGATGGRKGSASFGHLEDVAPAVAQVVKGFVYSPVGLYRIAAAAHQDLAALDPTNPKHLGQSDTSFKHLRAIGGSLVDQFIQDLNHPGDNAGNLFLDGLAVGSLGVGTVTRLGRFGGAIAEGEGLRAAAAAARAPHPLRTYTLSKDGIQAQIRLPQNPLFRTAAEWYLDNAQARLDRKTGVGTPVATDLFGNPMDRLLPGGSLSAKARAWADEHRLQRFNPLGTERFIGRAYSIQKQNEYAALSAANVLLHDIAGSSVRQTRMATLIPDRVMKGLTPAESKALEVLSWDLTKGTDPFTRARQVAEFVVNGGLGDDPVLRSNWRKQLRLIDQAKKAYDNPRPRLLHALDVVREVTAQQELLKGELPYGLAAQTAENRIVRQGALVQHFEDLAPRLAAGEEVFRTAPHGGVEAKIGEQWVPLNRNSPDSWYYKVQQKGKPQQRIGQGFARVGDTGLSPATTPSELKHYYTGDAFIRGDYRIDVHNLAGEQLAKTARAFVQWTTWKDAWNHGIKQQRPGYIPVRDVRDMPDELRRAFQQFEDEHIDVREAAALPEDVLNWLSPKTAEGKNVRWVDPLLFGNAIRRMPPTGAGAKAAARVNDALRPVIFYASPKYMLNALGNYGMLWLDQGFGRSYTNLLRAMQLDKTLSPEDLARVKAHVGVGRSESYVSPRSGHINQALAEFWSKMTDEKFRYASWIHYARAKGYETPADWHSLLTDKTHASDLNDVNRRANEALVVFDRMHPWEKAALRNFIFVYPWQRGAFLWSFRTLFEHPAKSALLATLGQDAYNDETWLKHATEWVKRAGYIPLDWSPDGSKVHVWSSMSFNTFQTLADVEQTLAAAVKGDKYASTGDLLGPPGQFAVHALTGRDQYGNQYPGSQIAGALRDTVGIIPQIAAAKNAMKKKPGGPTKLDIENLNALVTQENKLIKEVATQPGALGGFGRLIWGADSWLNMPAIAARYWRDAPPAERHKHEMQLVAKMLKAQGEFLNQPVPQDVRRAVKLQGEYAWYVKQRLLADQIDAPSEKQALAWKIDFYRQQGVIDQQTADQLHRDTANLKGPDIKAASAAVDVKYGHADAYAQWHDDVHRQNGAITNFDFRMSQLNRVGVAPKRVYKADPAQKLAYARAYVAYVNGRQKLVDNKATQEQLRLYDDLHDKPVDGLPSVTRFALTEGTTNEITKRTAGNVNAAWSSLSRAEKAALGVDTSEAVSNGWHFYNRFVKAVREQGGSVNRAQKLGMAKVTQQQYPGFMQDWLYSHRSKAERFQLTPFYRDMPERELFDQAVLAPARRISAAIVQAEKNGIPKAQKNGRELWHAYLDETLLPWLREHPELRREIAPLGAGFLRGLVNRGNA